LLDVVGISYREHDLTSFEGLQEIRATGKLMFNQLPLLEINGHNLVQCAAIIGYLARLGDLEPHSLEHKAIADMLIGGIADFREKVIDYAFEAAGAEAGIADIEKIWCPKYLAAFEHVLKNKAASKMHLVGTSRPWWTISSLRSCTG